MRTERERIIEMLRRRADAALRADGWTAGPVYQEILNIMGAVERGDYSGLVWRETLE